VVLAEIGCIHGQAFVPADKKDAPGSHAPRDPPEDAPLSGFVEIGENEIAAEHEIERPAWHALADILPEEPDAGPELLAQPVLFLHPGKGIGDPAFGQFPQGPRLIDRAPGAGEHIEAYCREAASKAQIPENAERVGLLATAAAGAPAAQQASALCDRFAGQIGQAGLLQPFKDLPVATEAGDGDPAKRVEFNPFVPVGR
jgi:hypothetical protein